MSRIGKLLYNRTCTPTRASTRDFSVRKPFTVYSGCYAAYKSPQSPHQRNCTLMWMSSRGFSAPSSLNTKFGVLCGPQSPQSPYRGTCTLMRMLSRGFSAPSCLSIKFRLLCGLQESIITLTYWRLFAMTFGPSPCTFSSRDGGVIESSR